MTKASDSLAPDPGKLGGADSDKLAGGYLDKEYVPPETDSSSYGGGYDDGGSGGDDGGGGGGGGGGSEDVAEDPPAEDTTEDPAPEDTAEDPADDDPLHADSDDDGEAPDPDDFGDTDHPTKPGDPVLEKPELEKPIQTETPNTTVSIDVEAMTRLVAAMERAGEQIVSLQDEMRTILSGVHLETSDTTRFDQVAEWIQEVLPGLRRRLAMAQDLLGEDVSTQPDHQRPVVPRPYVGDETQVSTKPIQTSYEAARGAAHRFGIPGDHDSTRELVADLQANRHDPYYAAELVRSTDPETLVRAVVAAGDDELTQLTAATVATAGRGTGELAPPAGYEEQWAALRDSDDPAVAAAAEQLRPA